MKAALGRGHGALDKREQVEPVLKVFLRHGVRFIATHAAETPEVLGEFVDQNFFGGVGGLVLGAQVGFEGIEVGWVFGRQHQRV